MHAQIHIHSRAHTHTAPRDEDGFKSKIENKIPFAFMLKR